MIYARQIAPEWQESPIFLDGMFPENIVVTGNRDYIIRTTAEYDRVLDTLESYAEVLESSWEYGYKCATEAAIDLLQPVKGKFSTGNIHALKGYFSRYGTWSSRDDKEIIARVLSLYCTSYKVQEEIAAYEGVKPEEVKLYEFSGFSKIPVYKAV